MAHFPIPAPAFDGRSRAVDASAVFDWLKQGWGIFMANPLLWVAAAAIVIAGLVALSFVWLPGQLLACLLMPILAAGLLAMCRRISAGNPCELQLLAAGFKSRTSPLMGLGLIMLLASLLIQAIVFLLLGGSIASMVAMPNVVGLGLLLGGSLLAFLLSFVLIVPLGMALWFAPALVFFNNVTPLGACRMSFNACLKNILPFLILGLVVFVLSFFAALPVGLGFIVLLPVLTGALYASYQDVFIAH